MDDRYPLNWWNTPDRDAALAKADRNWVAERAAFDDYAEVTRQSLAEGTDPARVRTWWTAALVKQNVDADAAAWAWMVSGLILRLAQSVQMDVVDLPELD